MSVQALMLAVVALDNRQYSTKHMNMPGVNPQDMPITPMLSGE